MGNKYEYRATTGLVVTDDAAKMTVRGRAIAFGEPKLMLEQRGMRYFEVVQASALDDCKLDDILLKVNHVQSGVTLARTRNKSLRLEKRDDGLYFEADIVNTTAGRDMYESIKSGLFTDVSFGFKCGADHYDRAENVTTRSIDKIGFLREISIVDNGAYGDAAYVEAVRDFYAARAEVERCIVDDVTRRRLIIKTYF